MKTEVVSDVFAAVVPPRLRNAEPDVVERELRAQALRFTLDQYEGARPRLLAFQTMDWMITSDPADIEKFQPAHDCATCRAGNDRAVAFLHEFPDAQMALANLTYTEVWP